MTPPEDVADFARRLAVGEPEALKKFYRDTREALDAARAEVADLRQQLNDSSAIRGALVTQTAALAKDMVIALDMLEGAYHAGYNRGAADEARGTTCTVDAAFKAWFKDAKVKMPKPGAA